MDLLTYLVPVAGGLLCLMAIAQLGFWAAQSWRIGTQSKQQFELTRELLRREIETAARQRAEQAESHPLKQNSRSKAISAAATMPATQFNEAASASAPLVTASVVVQSDGLWKGFRPFKVVQLVQETNCCRSVYLMPVDGQAIASFSGGQHLPIRLTIPGQTKPLVRCYSLSNGPGQPHYRLSIKAVPAPHNRTDLPAGLASNFINSQLQVGDIIEAKAPSGHFVADQKSTAPMIMLAGGIGITPMVSMLEEAFAKNSKRLMILAYGAVNKSDQAFKAWIDDAAEKHDNFHAIHCYSAPAATDIQGVDFQVAGYVSIDLLKKLLPTIHCQFYLCGPPPFMGSINQGLAAWGASEDQIFSEAFGPASRKVATKTDAAPATGTVTFVSSGKSLPWNSDGDAILEIAEQAGIEIDSGCRSGLCGTCATKLLSGAVAYDDDVECEPGECLPCIARPQGDVELDA